MCILQTRIGKFQEKITVFQKNEGYLFFYRPFRACKLDENYLNIKYWFQCNTLEVFMGFGQLFGILQTIIYEKNCKKPIKITQNFIEFFLITCHEIKETHPNFPNWHVTKWGTNFEGFQKIWVKMCILQTGIFRFFLEKWRFLKYSGHVHIFWLCLNQNPNFVGHLCEFLEIDELMKQNV